MAYGVKYRFQWSDSNDAPWKVDILKDGYSGDVLSRNIGGQSVSLRRDRNGNICGTSLELTAECKVDEEFAEFYTTDPFEFKVELYCNSNLLWQGYITPELYSEPYIAVPYDVNVTASDNLGELKRYEWTGAGRVSIASMLTTLLQPTGMGLTAKYISKLATSSIADSAFFTGVTLDLDELAGSTYYDVLDQLLASLHAVILQHDGNWVILREADVADSISSGSVIPAGAQSGYPFKSVTSMYAGGMWPEGHVDLTVDPAKKAISLICSELWSRAGTCTVNNPTLSGGGGASTAIFSVTFDAADGISLDETNQAGAFPLELAFEASRIYKFSRSSKVYYDAEIKITGNNMTKYLAPNDEQESGVEYIWKDTQSTIRITPSSSVLYYPGRGSQTASTSGEVVSIPLPQCDGLTALTKIEVTCTSNTQASGNYHPTRYEATVHFFDVWVSYSDQFDSLMDTISISNNARGAADDVRIIVSGLTDTAIEKYFISNSLLDSNGALIGAVHTDAFEGQDFISLLSRDYALSIAAPRLKATGVLNGFEVPTAMPLFLSMGGLDYIADTWDWDLIDGGLDFSAVSLPAVSITVTSESIVTGNGLGHASSSGGGGSASSGGSGMVPASPTLAEMYIGTTKGQSSPTEGQDLTGIGTATLAGYLKLTTTKKIWFGDDVYIEVDSHGYLHTNAGFYSDGFVSAGGIGSGGGSGSGSGGGGGGGMTPSAMWQLLAANTNEQINASHLSNALSGYQPLDADLTAIAGLTGTSGLLKKTAANTWTLDTSTYLTANQTITLSGDVSGSGTTAITTTIGNGKVTNSMLAGSIANSKLTNSSITINGTATSLGGSFTTASITAGTAGTSSATSGLSISVPYVTYNKYGIITAAGTHTHTISASDITTAIGGTTYAPYNSAGYLPLSGGTMTGDIKMTDGEYILSSGGKAMCGMNASSTFYSGPGYEASASFVLRSANIALTHRKHTSASAYTDYTIWDASNSNLSTVDWAAKNITAAGTLSVTGASTLANVTVGSSNSITLGSGVLTWDSTNSAWKLTGNFYATGFVSAGGVSSGSGGGGGGIDPSTMWSLLGANTTEQINVSHLTTALSGYLTSASAASTYLPLALGTGKTLTGNSGVQRPLTIVRNNAGSGQYVAIGFSTSDTDLGAIGMSGVGVGFIRAGSNSTYYTIYTTNNLTSSAITGILDSGSIANAKLANSAITINGTSTSLGGSFSTASITAGTAGTSSATSGLSISIPYVTLNAYGVATAYGTHTHTISASNITTAIGSTTYAPYNADGYLPLSGGVMTGTIDMSNAVNIRSKDSGGTALTIMGLSDANAFHLGYGTAGQGYVTNIYGDSISFKYGTSRTLGATLNSDGQLVLANAVPLASYDSNDAVRTLISLGATNACYIAYGVSQAGYTTNLCGNRINLRYGTTPTTGFILNSDGKAGFGFTDTTYMYRKFNVSGEMLIRGTATDAPGKLVIGNGTHNATGGAGEIIFQEYALATDTTSGARNGYRIAAEHIATYDRVKLTFYRSNVSTSPYAANWIALMTLMNNARVGIVNTDPQYTLDVTGTIHATTGIFADGYVSAGGLSSTSDARMKTDLKDIDLSLDAIADAPAVTFHWKNETTSPRQAGSLAQYWEKVLPESVREVAGYLTLDYGATALLSTISVARKVKDHEARIAELEKENEQLKAKVYGLG